MQLYLEGLLLGVPLIFLVGPVLITLLQISLQYGFKAGFFVAIGITAGDILYILFCYWGASQLLSRPLAQQILGLAGGGVLLLFGLAVLLHRPSSSEQIATPTLKNKHFFASFVKGFLINFVNPFVLTFWVGSVGLVASRHHFSFSKVSLFFLGTITVIFVSDTLKALLAARLKSLLSPSLLLWLHRTAGAGLFCCGLYLLWRGWGELFL